MRSAGKHLGFTSVDGTCAFCDRAVVMTSGGAATARKRILVVEDEEAIRRMLEITLGKVYDVRVAVDGPTGIALAREFLPQLLMLDVMLPGMTGFEIAKELRAIPGLEKVPLAFLTAKDDPASMAQGIHTGARHYIIKPFNIKEVLKLVERMLR